MEEILSSIKRIIAEDSEASLAPPRTRRTSPVQPVADPFPRPTDPSPREDVLELTETVAADENDRAANAPNVEPQPQLVSDKTAEASRSSLAILSALIVKPEIAGNDTLEGLVREMLKPMLAEWLEQRLPDVVERLVAQEIRRITDRG